MKSKLSQNYWSADILEDKYLIHLADKLDMQKQQLADSLYELFIREYEWIDSWEKATKHAILLVDKLKKVYEAKVIKQIKQEINNFMQDIVTRADRKEYTFLEVVDYLKEISNGKNILYLTEGDWNLDNIKKRQWMKLLSLWLQGNEIFFEETIDSKVRYIWLNIKKRARALFQKRDIEEDNTNRKATIVSWAWKTNINNLQRALTRSFKEVDPDGIYVFIDDKDRKLKAFKKSMEQILLNTSWEVITLHAAYDETTKKHRSTNESFKDQKSIISQMEEICKQYRWKNIYWIFDVDRTLIDISTISNTILSNWLEIFEKIKID